MFSFGKSAENGKFVKLHLLNYNFSIYYLHVASSGSGVSGSSSMLVVDMVRTQSSSRWSRVSCDRVGVSIFVTKISCLYNEKGLGLVKNA